MSANKSFTIVGIYLFNIIGLSTTANAGESITQFLRAFHKDPAKMMQRLPSMVDSSGNAHPRGFIQEDSPKLQSMMQLRSQMRTTVMTDSLLDDEEGNPSDPDNPNTNRPDDPAQIVDNNLSVVRNLLAMQQLHLTEYTLPEEPWADSYWPLYKGNIANRYADKGFPDSKDWMVNHSYEQMFPAYSILSYGSASQINALSPAEKYDIAVGDSEYTLTNFAWNRGQRSLEQWGTVPSWMGICHGWSGATTMKAKYPEAPVSVTSTRGTSILFYPQDVKALQSMLWANASPKTRFAGNRCDISHPSQSNNGRILDPKCLDVNPMTWHIAIVNQMGINKRSFVMDGTYDAEVWNFPLVSYKYKYFNPQTWQEYNDMQSARIPIQKFTVDKFKEFRSPFARNIVGVFMDVTFIKEIQPTRNSKVKNPIGTVRYVYDLELNDDGNIVHGEWYSNAHPDFIWTFAPNAQAMHSEDLKLGSDFWNATLTVPDRWTRSANIASRRGVPLWTFIKGLIPAAPPITPEPPTPPEPEHPTL